MAALGERDFVVMDQHDGSVARLILAHRVTSLRYGTWSLGEWP
jgi:hypothetical protein